MRTAAECREHLEQSELYRRRELEARQAQQLAKMRAWQYLEEDANKERIIRVVEVRL
jgi:hypothetical protein